MFYDDGPSFLHHTEAAEVRARGGSIYCPTNRGATYDVRMDRVGKDHDRGTNLGVQVQIERAVMVDYTPNSYRESRSLPAGERSSITNGITSSDDHGRFELSERSSIPDTATVHSLA